MFFNMFESDYDRRNKQIDSLKASVNSGAIDAKTGFLALAKLYGFDEPYRFTNSPYKMYSNYDEIFITVCKMLSIRPSNWTYDFEDLYKYNPNDIDIQNAFTYMTETLQ